MMRRFGIGLALGVAALMAASASYAKDKDTSATDLPPLIAAAQAPCTMTDARFIAEGVGSDKIKAKYYEAACKEGLGYVIILKDKVPTPEAYDCFTMGQPGADGKPGMLACKLPANLKPLVGLQTLFNSTGHNCTVANARLIGSSAVNTFVELACQDNQGYVFGLTRHVGGPAPIEFSCYDPNAKGNLACTLTDSAKMLSATMTQLVAASGKACTVKDSRYIGTTTDGTGIYEVACDSGKGLMFETVGDKFKTAVDCALAVNIAGGCTLTDSRAAETAQSALYTGLAKKAGFDCTVNKYAAFPVDAKDKEVVELSCANRPDGGVGIFSFKGVKPVVYDCLRSQAEGYKCSFSQETTLYPKYSAQLKALGKGSCVVSGARPLGKTDNTDLIEVACADGGLGWVMEYPAVGAEIPHLIPCAGTTMGGGCQLPTNKKK
ncbi:MAG TPA: hypothetical protein VGI79_06895 [Caulobacteraceae bacterium]|jgi:hypothetical protein